MYLGLMCCSLALQYQRPEGAMSIIVTFNGKKCHISLTLSSTTICFIRHAQIVSYTYPNYVAQFLQEMASCCLWGWFISCRFAIRNCVAFSVRKLVVSVAYDTARTEVIIGNLFREYSIRH